MAVVPKHCVPLVGWSMKNGDGAASTAENGDEDGHCATLALVRDTRLFLRRAIVTTMDASNASPMSLVGDSPLCDLPPTEGEEGSSLVTGSVLDLSTRSRVPFVKPIPRKASHVDGIANARRSTARIQQQIPVAKSWAAAAVQSVPLGLPERCLQRNSGCRLWLSYPRGTRGAAPLCSLSDAALVFARDTPLPHELRGDSRPPRQRQQDWLRRWRFTSPIRARCDRPASFRQTTQRPHMWVQPCAVRFPPPGHDAPFIHFHSWPHAAATVAFHPSGSRGCVCCLSHLAPPWRMDGTMCAHWCCLESALGIAGLGSGSGAQRALQNSHAQQTRSPGQGRPNQEGFLHVLIVYTSRFCCLWCHPGCHRVRCRQTDKPIRSIDGRKTSAREPRGLKTQPHRLRRAPSASVLALSTRWPIQRWRPPVGAT